MTTKNKNIITTILLAAATIALIVFLIRRNLQSQAPRENHIIRFNKELDSLAAVDTALIGYIEMDGLELPFERAATIHVDSRDRLFAAADSTLYLLDPLGRQLKSARLGAPIHGISVHENGTIYVASVNRITIVDSGWSNTSSWDIGDTNTLLVSVAVEGNNVFAGDAGRATVLHLDTAGRELGRIGDKNSTRNIPGLVIPGPNMDMAIGRNSLWVVNTGRHRIENYRLNGDLLSSWGEPGAHIEGFAGCCGPIHMAQLPDGSFVTGEKGFARVKLYDQAGRFVSVVAPPSFFKGPNAGLSLAADSHGTIYVLDTYENTIRKFRKKNT